MKPMNARYATVMAVAACAGLGAAPAMGATWTGAGDGTNWSDTNNWSGGALPSASDPAYFNASGGAHTTINVDSTTAIANGIQVSAGKSYTIGGNAITIPRKAAISTSGTSSSLVLNSDVILRDATVSADRSGYGTVGAGGSLTINGDVKTSSTAGSYDFQLAGGVVINGDVGTSLPSTSLRMYSNSAPAGTIATLNGVNTASIGMDVTWGTFVLNDAGAITNAAVSTPAGRGGNVTIAAKNALTGTGSISLGSNTAQKTLTATLIQADQDYTGNTTITGNPWVGQPTYTATLTVNNGHTSLGSATGSGAVTVTGGLLAGDGRIANAAATGVKLQNNGSYQSYLSPGATDGTAGTLAFALSGTNGLDISGAVANTGTGALLFDLDTPSSSDLVTLAGKLKLGSGKLEFDDFNFNLLGGFGAGTYTLFQTNTVITDTLGSNLSGTLDGKLSTLSLDGTGKNIVLTVVPEPATLGLLAIGGLGLLGRRRRMA